MHNERNWKWKGNHIASCVRNETKQSPSRARTPYIHHRSHKFSNHIILLLLFFHIELNFIITRSIFAFFRSFVRSYDVHEIRICSLLVKPCIEHVPFWFFRIQIMYAEKKVVIYIIHRCLAAAPATTSEGTQMYLFRLFALVCCFFVRFIFGVRRVRCVCVCVRRVSINQTKV